MKRSINDNIFMPRSSPSVARTIDNDNIIGREMTSVPHTYGHGTLSPPVPEYLLRSRIQPGGRLNNFVGSFLINHREMKKVDFRSKHTLLLQRSISISVSLYVRCVLCFHCPVHEGLHTSISRSSSSGVISYARSHTHTSQHNRIPMRQRNTIAPSIELLEIFIKYSIAVYLLKHVETAAR